MNLRLLLDQGCPRTTVDELRPFGIEAVHVGEIGYATVSDRQILDCAARNGLVVVTLDADFHAILAVNNLSGPSVIRIRIEGLRGPALAELLAGALQTAKATIATGAAVSLEPHRLRVHALPLASN